MGFGVVDLQKTGSTVLNHVIAKSLSTAPRQVRTKFLIPGVQWEGTTWSWCVHHADVDMLITCMLRNNLSVDRKRMAIFFITMLRDPLRRLRSEFSHLQGGVSCQGGSWRIFHPSNCDGKVVNWTSPDPATSARAAQQVMLYKQILNRQRKVSKAKGKLKLDQGNIPLYEQWLSLKGNCACNRMSRQLAGPYGCVEKGHLESDLLFDKPRLLRSALDNLKQRAIFGLMEDFQRSLEVMEYQMAKLFPHERLLSKWLRLSPLTTAYKQLGYSNFSDRHVDFSKLNHTLESACATLDIPLYQKASELHAGNIARLNFSRSHDNSRGGQQRTLVVIDS